jgi:SET domain-containing protein 6
MDLQATSFVAWFKRHGTQHNAIGLTTFPGMGRGAVALEDIPVH